MRLGHLKWISCFTSVRVYSSPQISGKIAQELNVHSLYGFRVGRWPMYTEHFLLDVKHEIHFKWPYDIVF